MNRICMLVTYYVDDEGRCLRCDESCNLTSNYLQNEKKTDVDNLSDEIEDRF